MSWRVTVVGILQAGYVMLEVLEAGERVMAKAPPDSPIGVAALGTAGHVIFRKGRVHTWQPAAVAASRART